MLSEGDNFPSVCYSLRNFTDKNDRILKYAWKDNIGWHTETIDENGDRVGYSSLAIDSDDNPHLSYYNPEENELRYAWKDVSGWHIEMFDDVGYACYTSLALDDDGYPPHISYSEGGVDEVRYACKDAAGWHIETFDTVDAIYTSLSLDSAGYPHVSYVLNGEKYLKYAWKDASGWHSERVVGGGCGTDEGCLWEVHSLALGGNDMPPISVIAEVESKI
ncbi:hypothetical protein [Methanogenium cariaci]|uniref:hypothetical protein n=1 Tax=Methanogenium cariaci TaxID=2197 RepID=UPI0012F6DBB1|nr:hypothetical protein [Methanogenium cariaci]